MWILDFYHTWNLLSCLHVQINIFQIWEVLGHHFSKYFLSFLSFWFSHNAHVGELDGLPQIPWAVCTSFFFLRLRLNYCSFYIQVYLFFLMLPQICWTPLMYFFHVIVLFQLQNFYMVPFYNFSIDILILFIYYFPGFLYCLIIPETVGLKSLSSKCDVWASSGMDSVIFFSFEWAILPNFFVCTVILLFQTGHLNYSIILKIRIFHCPRIFWVSELCSASILTEISVNARNLKNKLKYLFLSSMGWLCAWTLYHLARPFMILTQPSLSECTKPRPMDLFRSFLSIIPILAF